ncbi:MAG: tyrosine-type recombinase/integrase [Alphaproteobacteria bacterium]|nr:tyrosine-type recombinase/integrase [Alphaproteobacteria bacterium]NCQ88940.1 tyrosine-type recombinase/integrase [Alphaproteobacteria bacterium]NCT07842.1 tyrosine-type recombinase/integrase [Alphaproteobacteria bacterium]
MPKIIKRLTNQEISNAESKEKPYRLNDGDRLHLLIRPNGRKVWQVSYTLAGKKNTHTIGEFSSDNRIGFVSLKEARELRDCVIKLVKDGVDPNQRKQDVIKKNEGIKTFEEIARQWHEKGNWVERYKKRIISSLENDAFPFIGKKPISQITRADINAVASQIEGRGKLEAAKRVIKRCEAVIDYSIHLGLCDQNVAMGVTRFMKAHVKKHRPFLKEKDFPEFLNKLDNYQGRDYIKIAMGLQILTFVRPGELRNAPWSEIDFENKIWRIPAKRMKMRRDHIVPLSKQALNLLAHLKGITGSGKLLFPAVNKAYKPISDTALLKVLKTMGYVDEKKITVHGFRHSASTLLNENQFNADAIEMQLAHASKNQIRGTYNHAQYLDERTKMMQWYADYLDLLKQKI